MGAAPIHFHCAVARRNQWFDSHAHRLSGQRGIRAFYRYPDGHDTIVRTGRVRGDEIERDYGQRTLLNKYEYRCSCGHIGWTKHRDVLRYPIEEEIHGG